MKLNTSLQGTGQPTHRTYPQWNTECTIFLKNFSNRRTATTKSELIKGAKELWSEIKSRTQLGENLLIQSIIKQKV